MVREDILGGLRTALSRGQTLRQAMMSFYNAGYIKEEIEEAAKALLAEKNQPAQTQFAPGPSAPIFQRSDFTKTSPDEKPREVLSQAAKQTQPTQQTTQKVSAYGTPAQPAKQSVQIQPVQQPTQQTTQKISAYPPQVQQVQSSKPKGKTIIFILIALLIILVIGLIAVFFFKDEILAFFE